jgi:osmotically inducible lipoprotein OsmB
MQRFSAATLTATVLLGLSACSSMSAREKDSAIGTVGGAAAGGVIGNQVGKDKE